MFMAQFSGHLNTFFGGTRYPDPLCKNKIEPTCVQNRHVIRFFPALVQISECFNN